MSGTTERIDLGRRPLLGESDPLNLSHSSLYRPRRRGRRGVWEAEPEAGRCASGESAWQRTASCVARVAEKERWRCPRIEFQFRFNAVCTRCNCKTHRTLKDSLAERPRRHDVSDRTTGVRGPGGAPVQIMRYACLAQDALLAGAVELDEGILRLLGRFLLRT